MSKPKRSTWLTIAAAAILGLPTAGCGLAGGGRDEDDVRWPRVGNSVDAEATGPVEEGRRAPAIVRRGGALWGKCVELVTGGPEIAPTDAKPDSRWANACVAVRPHQGADGRPKVEVFAQLDSPQAGTFDPELRLTVGNGGAPVAVHYQDDPKSPRPTDAPAPWRSAYTDPFDCDTAITFKYDVAGGDDRGDKYFYGVGWTVRGATLCDQDGTAVSNTWFFRAGEGESQPGEQVALDAPKAIERGPKNDFGRTLGLHA